MDEYSKGFLRNLALVLGFGVGLVVLGALAFQTTMPHSFYEITVREKQDSRGCTHYSFTASSKTVQEIEASGSVEKWLHANPHVRGSQVPCPSGGTIKR